MFVMFPAASTPDKCAMCQHHCETVPSSHFAANSLNHYNFWKAQLFIHIAKTFGTEKYDLIMGIKRRKT